MEETIQRIDWFAEREPTMCVWCRWCGVVMLGDAWGYVCIRSIEAITKRVKNAIRPFPVNTEGKRSRVQCVNADEYHPECFVPTKRADKRIETIGMLGLMPEGE